MSSSAGMGSDPPLAQTSYDELVESLVDVGTRAFNPDSPADSRAASLQEFDELVQRAGTIPIIPALNTLIHPGRVPAWLRTRFVDVLAAVPLRRYGVRATLEFVFAVHPSSAAGASGGGELPGKQGASITQEAMAMASRLLATPPASIPAEKWYSGIAPQLLGLLDGRNGLELTKVAAYVVGFGILGRRQYGAPGTPGWRCFAEPMMHSIMPDTKAQRQVDRPGVEGDDSVVDLSKDAILVCSADLATGLRRLQSLVISHPNPGLARRLLRPLLLPLWSLLSKRSSGSNEEDDYRRPARNLLTILLKVANSLDPVIVLIDNLLYNGHQREGKLLWTYQVASSGAGIQIVAPRQLSSSAFADQTDLQEVEVRNKTLLELLGGVYADDDISSIFLDLFNRWIGSGETQKKEPLLIRPDNDEAERNPLHLLFEGQALQAMMQSFPEKLAGQPGHILELVNRLLAETHDLSRDDEVVSVALSLLSLIATTPNFQRSRVDKELLDSIESSLDRVSRTGDGDTATTAGNLALFLKYRDEVEDPNEVASGVTDRQVEDRKTYALAVSYITQTDSPPPVRSEGLSLIQGLITANSPILDVPGILVLMSSLLAENEDYINLRVIKIYSQLANRHPKAVTKELVDRYVDTSEMAGVDTRLRFGEALLQVIERFGETFAGEAAQQVCQALLLIAGRRAHRAKTKAKQDREERMHRMKAERGGGDDAGDMDADDEEGLSQQEQADNEILARIVDGWGSKRGDEDVRVRGSALSIFAVAVETNIAGIGSDLVSSAVDLCMQVLTLEPEVEKGILRRAAVLVVLGFVRALDGARQARRRLGFGLTDDSRNNITRILEYVADTDSDGLVKQHARDVVESLENWTLSSLLPPEEDTPSSAGLAGIGLERGVGLSNLGSARSGVKPIIEEIE